MIKKIPAAYGPGYFFLLIKDKKLGHGFPVDLFLKSCNRLDMCDSYSRRDIWIKIKILGETCSKWIG